ncbi:MAG: glycosyltransferase family 2 protein [bacterium]
MLSGKAISIVIPAYNEADIIGETIAAVRGLDLADEIVVVNDGSQDDTSRVARQAGAVVVDLPRNRGKGAALNEGVPGTLGEILLFLDADLGTSAAEAIKIIQPIANGECDLAVGKFSSPGGFGFVLKLSRWGVRRFCGFKATAPLSGQRAMRRAVLRAVFPFQEDFGVETKMLIDVVRGGFRVMEIPVDTRHRATKKDISGFIHRGRQGWGVLHAIASSVPKQRYKKI